MLNRTRRVVALAVGLALLTACGSQAAGSETTTSAASVVPGVVASNTAVSVARAADLCTGLVAKPALGTGLKLLTSRASTTDLVDQWLGGRSQAGGPADSLANFVPLQAKAAGDGLAVCVLTGPPRLISVPSEVTTPADGVLVIVDSTGAFAVDGYGPSSQLLKDLATLGS